MDIKPELSEAKPKCDTVELTECAGNENEAELKADSSASTTESKPKKTLLCALAICLGPVIAETVIDYPSPAVPNLNANPNPFHVNADQTSWIGSVVPLAAIFGGLVGGPLMDRIGRKMSLMTCAVLGSVFSIVVVASPNFPCLLVGRALTGVVLGLLSVTCPIYIGEVAPAAIRGLLSSCFMLAVSTGSLYVYILGAFLSWTWLAVAIAGLHLVFIIAMTFVPESPRWLLSVGRREDAEFAIRWLNGGETMLKKDLNELQAAVQQSKTRLSFMELLQPDLLKRLMVALGMMFFHELCGSKVVSVYTVHIFQMSKSSLDPNMQTIAVGAMAIVGNLVCVFASDYVGRKLLLVASGLLMTLVMGSMGAFFYILELDHEYATGSLAWLPMACLMIFNFGYGVAFGPIPFLIMSELFAPRVKGVASGITVAFNWLLAFVTIKFFALVTDSIHPYGSFWVCAGFCALSLPFVVFCVRETKGKTLEELQNGTK